MPQNKDFILIDMHIPYEGEIPQTGLFIPHNEIEQNADKLSEDKSSKLVVYCRSGPMSAIATKS
jgi:rhodanese-related sulfurtransferase